MRSLSPILDKAFFAQEKAKKLEKDEAFAPVSRLSKAEQYLTKHAPVVVARPLFLRERKAALEALPGMMDETEQIKVLFKLVSQLYMEKIGVREAQGLGRAVVRPLAVIEFDAKDTKPDLALLAKAARLMSAKEPFRSTEYRPKSPIEELGLSEEETKRYRALEAKAYGPSRAP